MGSLKRLINWCALLWLYLCLCLPNPSPLRGAQAVTFFWRVQLWKEQFLASGLEHTRHGSSWMCHSEEPAVLCGGHSGCPCRSVEIWWGSGNFLFAAQPQAWEWAALEATPRALLKPPPAAASGGHDGTSWDSQARTASCSFVEPPNRTCAR